MDTTDITSKKMATGEAKTDKTPTPTKSSATPTKPDWFTKALEIITTENYYDAIEREAEAVTGATNSVLQMSTVEMTELKRKIEAVKPSRELIRGELTKVSEGEMPKGKDYNELKTMCELVIASHAQHCMAKEFGETLQILFGRASASGDMSEIVAFAKMTGYQG